MKTLVLKNFLNLALLFVVPLSAKAHTTDKIHLSLDLYAVHSSLMPYKGTQSDASATLHLNFANSRLKPFLRAVMTNFNYKDESVLPNLQVNDERKAAGGGLDIDLNAYVKIRLLSEYIMNKNANTQYSQDSYGLIYNQYLSLGALDLNNYAEVFQIPRFSRETIDLFARFQLLKPFYISSSEESSNVLFPFLQYKLKENDNAIFGISGNQLSVGAGYKYFNKNIAGGSAAFLIEGHSVAYQSTNYNGDWLQVLAAIQYIYN